MQVKTRWRYRLTPIRISSVQFSRSVMSNSLRLHGLQHARPPCPSPTPRVYSNSCPLSDAIQLVMPSNHLILCHPLLLPPSIFPSIRVFSNESVLRIKWPTYWSFSFSISPSSEYSGMISFRMDSLLEWLLAKRSQIVNVGKDVEKREPSYTVSGNVNWYNHYGKQYGGC